MTVALTVSFNIYIGMCESKGAILVQYEGPHSTYYEAWGQG